MANSSRLLTVQNMETRRLNAGSNSRRAACYFIRFHLRHWAGSGIRTRPPLRFNLPARPACLNATENRFHAGNQVDFQHNRQQQNSGRFLSALLQTSPTEQNLQAAKSSILDIPPFMALGNCARSTCSSVPFRASHLPSVSCSRAFHDESVIPRRAEGASARPARLHLSAGP